MASTAISEGKMMLSLTLQRKKYMKNGRKQKTFLIITVFLEYKIKEE